MALHSLKHKPDSAVSTSEHDLSVLHTQSDLPFSEKTNAANRTKAVSFIPSLTYLSVRKPMRQTVQKPSQSLNFGLPVSAFSPEVSPLHHGRL